MNDMSMVIVAKSDQMNADDLIGGPRTITVTEVVIKPGTEQPVSMRFEGDEGKPYKPCKSMCRVLVSLWGADAKQYTGRSMTLYRDPKVLWGGMAVGGIRISHMSHINQEATMALTATKGSKKAFVVKPLKVEAPKSEAPQKKPWIDQVRDKLAACADAAAVGKVEQTSSVQSALGAESSVKAQVRGMLNAAYARCGALDDAGLDDFPGVTTPRTTDSTAEVDALVAGVLPGGSTAMAG